MSQLLKNELEVVIRRNKRANYADASELKATTARELAIELEIPNAETISASALYRKLERANYSYNVYREDWELSI